MASKRQGLRFFTNEQVIAEAKAQGIYNKSSSSAFLREKLETRLARVSAEGTAGLLMTVMDRPEVWMDMEESNWNSPAILIW